MMRLEVDEIFYTQDSISNTFSNGEEIEDLIWELESGYLSVDDIPPISVYCYKGKWWSLDNRRLYCFKKYCPYVDVPVIVKRLNNKIIRQFTNRNNGESIEIRDSSENFNFEDIINNFQNLNVCQRSNDYDVCEQCNNKAAFDCDFGLCGSCCTVPHCNRHGTDNNFYNQPPYVEEIDYDDSVNHYYDDNLVCEFCNNKAAFDCTFRLCGQCCTQSNCSRHAGYNIYHDNSYPSSSSDYHYNSSSSSSSDW